MSSSLTLCRLTYGLSEPACGIRATPFRTASYVSDDYTRSADVEVSYPHRPSSLFVQG